MEPTGINDNIPYLIGKAQHLFHLQVTNLFRKNKVNITPEQFSVLTILWYKDGISQQEIANLLNRDKTTLTRLINNMEKRNLVVRVPNRTDKRIRYIYLTHRGRKLQNELVSLSGQIYMDSIAGFSKKSLTQYVDFLNQTINNLHNVVDTTS